MKTDTSTNITQRIIHEEVQSLVLTFTHKEVKALLAIGGTSHYDRVRFLDKTNRPYDNELCSSLLGDIYFAASDFNRNLAGT